MKAHIFLSYSSTDVELASAVVRGLQAYNWTVWWDRKIPGGRKWRDEIGNQLSGVNCILVLWSKHSVASDHVRAEASVGLQRGILVPVSIEPVTLPLPFGEVQALDLSGWNRDPGDPTFRALVSAVSAALAGTLHLERPPVRPGVPAAVRWLAGIGICVALICILLAVLLWRQSPSRAEPPRAEDVTAFHDSAGVFQVSYPSSLGAATVSTSESTEKDSRTYGIYFGLAPTDSLLRQFAYFHRQKPVTLQLWTMATQGELDDEQWRGFSEKMAAAEDKISETRFGSTQLASQTRGQNFGEQKLYRESRVSFLWWHWVAVSYLECREGVFLKGSGLIWGSHWDAMKSAYRRTFAELKWSPSAARAVLGVPPLVYEVVLPSSLEDAATMAALGRVRDSLSLPNVKVTLAAQKERASETAWSLVVIGTRVPPRVFTPVLRLLNRELQISYIRVGWSKKLDAEFLKTGIDLESRVYLRSASPLREAGKPPLSENQVNRLLGDWSSRKEFSDWVARVTSAK